MNKSVLIATCDFLVLAVLSLNPNDKGSYSTKTKVSTPEKPTPYAAVGIIKPSDDFKVEPIKQIANDDFENQLLLLAADEEKNELISKLKQQAKKEKSELSKKLELARKDADKTKSQLQSAEINKKELQLKLAESSKTAESLKKAVTAEKSKFEQAAKQHKQLDSELAELRKSFVSITGSNQENQAMLTKLQKENKTIADSRTYMKSKLLESLIEKRQMKAELEKIKKLNAEIAKSKKDAELKLQKIADANSKLQTDLKVSLYKHEVAIKSQEKVEAKLEKVAEERNELQSDLAVTKKESEVLNKEVNKLQKQIFGPSPEINRALYKTTIKIKEDDYMTSSYTHSSYSPVVKINGKYYTLANFRNMWLNKAIVPYNKLLEFSIMQKSEVTAKEYRVSKSFNYFTKSPQTLLIPCVPDTNAIKISSSTKSITDALPTLFIMKHDSGKVLKLDNMFYDRESKRLVMERGLSEEASANQPALGDLIVDPKGDLVAIFSIRDRSFSMKKSTRLEAFIVTENELQKSIDIQNRNKISPQIKSLKWAIND